MLDKFSKDYYDFIIIGNGISSKLVLWNLLLLQKNKEKKILVIYENDFFPSCSLQSSPIVSLGVHKKGLSNLGDLLVKSEVSFVDFINLYCPDGVYPAKQLCLLPTDKREEDEFIRRYGKCESLYHNRPVAIKESYIIDPVCLFKWFDRKNKRPNVKFKQASVLKVNERSILLRNHQEISFSSIFLCAGTSTSFLFKEESLPMGKSVSGSYLKFNRSLNNENFILTSNGLNLINRPNMNDFTFGSSTYEGHIYEGDRRSLKDFYIDFKKEVEFLDLPAFEDGIIHTGIRHKGKRRRPSAVRFGNVYVLNSLYRNGFTFSFFLAKSLVEENI